MVQKVIDYHSNHKSSFAKENSLAEWEEQVQHLTHPLDLHPDSWSSWAVLSKASEILSNKGNIFFASSNSSILSADFLTVSNATTDLDES